MRWVMLAGGSSAARMRLRRAAALSAASVGVGVCGGVVPHPAVAWVDDVGLERAPLWRAVVAELLGCTRCLPKPDDQILLSPRMEGAVQHYDVPVPDFTFSVYPAGEHALTTTSAEILFAIDGTVILQQGKQSLRLEKGQSAFIPAATGSYQLLAEGRVARAGNRC